MTTTTLPSPAPWRRDGVETSTVRDARGIPVLVLLSTAFADGGVDRREANAALALRAVNADAIRAAALRLALGRLEAIPGEEVAAAAVRDALAVAEGGGA